MSETNGKQVQISVLKAQFEACKLNCDTKFHDQERRITEVEGNQKELYAAINRRLPLWANSIVTLMALTIGWLAAKLSV